MLQCFPHIDFTWASRLMRPSAIDELLENLPSPYTFRTARSVCSNCRHSDRQPPVFPICSFIYGGPQQYTPPTAISSHVSHTRARL